MDLKLFNTLSGSKEIFQPLVPGQVSIYTCGPTVYSDAHIGNLRSYVFPDVLKKTLRRLGYRVNHVINITDVGHLASDADEGEDKMERAARDKGATAWELAALYTERFKEDIRRLHVDPPDNMPKATDHIPEQIALIQTLEQKNFVYRTQDGIYFDTARLPDYGKLARLDTQGLREGSRVARGEKMNKTDFALWKFSPPGVRRQMEWDSPWGRGFPGWHIECSAMAMKYLGDLFDIHTGGKDHIPVHHTNEIAQSEAAVGHPFVRYWLHGEFLVVDSTRDGGERMGKSEGNFLRLQEVIDRGFDPLSYRYLVLNSHYRKFLHFSWDSLKAAETALMGLRRLVREVPWPGNNLNDPTNSAFRDELLADLCDDLNTPKALATLWTTLKNPLISPSEKGGVAALAEELLCLGLNDFSGLDQVQSVPVGVETLARKRLAAREDGNWGESDRLRDEIARLGYQVRDIKGGYELEKSKL
ncbi:MAG: cysteine--tRNA ligase [Deltaproteobacteria bacterium]|nr:cysteine--tRNA ligase [Deltaproteobacteria bacterium]